MVELRKLMNILLKFDLPYSLGIDGHFQVRTPAGQDFQVELNTYYEPDPRFPGAQHIQNVAIVHDDTNIISHTTVVARYSLPDGATLNPMEYSDEVSSVALSVANTLVTGARVAHGSFIKDYLHSPSRLGPITFEVDAVEAGKGFSGVFDPLMGGITMGAPARVGLDTNKFASIVASGAPISVSQELYFDARRYLIQRNHRMALANLVISFEVGLADALAKIAASRNESLLERQILEATLGVLGGACARQTLGESFDKSVFWGQQFTDTYQWLREARNKVLHRARTAITRNAVTRDFADRSTLEQFFSEHDLLKEEIKQATANVLQGLPAK